MNSRHLLRLTLVGWAVLTVSSSAQDTNVFGWVPATKLEAFETNVSSVIIKATSEVGSLAVNSGLLEVRCREITDTATARKEQGLAIDLTVRGGTKDKMLVDYDELDGLLKGVEYLSKIDVAVTSLDTFDAVYTTRGGFRVAVLGNRRTSAITFAVRDARTYTPPLAFSRSEMTRLWELIGQAKKELDSAGR